MREEREGEGEVMVMMRVVRWTRWVHFGRKAERIVSLVSKMIEREVRVRGSRLIERASLKWKIPLDGG